MSKPIARPQADPDIGPLDEQGQQIWSADDEIAINRLLLDEDYRQSVRDALADADAGHVHSHEEVFASMAEMKRRWRAERER